MLCSLPEAVHLYWELYCVSLTVRSRMYFESLYWVTAKWYIWKKLTPLTFSKITKIMVFKGMIYGCCVSKEFLCYGIMVCSTTVPTISTIKLLIWWLISALLVFLWSIIKCYKKAKCILIKKSCAILVVSFLELLCFVCRIIFFYIAQFL